MKLTNKVAIVTAAGRGIGRSIALCLAEEGADVVVNSYNEDTTTRTAGDVQALGRRGLAMPCDITKSDAITHVVEETLNTFGKIDILVNNVGAGPKTWNTSDAGPLSQWIDLWDNMYEQNLKAPVLMCEAVVPHMMEQKSGKIVNIASIAGRVALPLKLQERVVPQSYSAMKAGLISYTQTLSERLGPHNINVNCVCPGIVYTDDWADSSTRIVNNVPEFQGQDAREWFVGIAHGKYPDMFGSTPLGREQMVEDIGRAVVYFVSDDGVNITGQTLNVDGGMVKN
jgi:NAD(P)-dependent dehydrogenase (short-subunit alcohol dehydrogenase family)